MQQQHSAADDPMVLSPHRQFWAGDEGLSWEAHLLSGAGLVRRAQMELEVQELDHCMLC